MVIKFTVYPISFDVAFTSTAMWFRVNHVISPSYGFLCVKEGHKGPHLIELSQEMKSWLKHVKIL
jgi:hypothetical protein